MKCYTFNKNHANKNFLVHHKGACRFIEVLDDVRHRHSSLVGGSEVEVSGGVANFKDFLIFGWDGAMLETLS